MCDSLGYRAILQRPDGIIYVDPARCTGCQRCIPTCRYKAIFFNATTRKAEKCDFCRRRIDAGQLPACVITCLAITREFGTYGQLKALHPNAHAMGDRVKILYDNLGEEPEHDGSTAGYPSPVECHH
jgi:Fe-S-cluster-containing dehydrogenase component